MESENKVGSTSASGEQAAQQINRNEVGIPKIVFPVSDTTAAEDVFREMRVEGSQTQFS